MFPFVFKLWRYHGLPTVDEIPDISRVQPAPPVGPAAAFHLVRADVNRLRADLHRIWEERYLSTLWGKGPPHVASGPRVILIVDDGGPDVQGALKTAQFLAKRWRAALAESPAVRSVRQVLDIAAAEGADWIVIGQVPRRETDRVRTGSLTEAVVKESDLPVLVDGNGSLAGGVRRILIPVDGTAASLVSVAEGLRWARIFAAELMILHVEEGDPAKETEHAAFLDILETIRWRSVAHETRTGRGTIAEAILAAAREGKADLILMGTHRAKIDGELLPQSHGLNVVRGADRPVMILHPYCP